MTELIVPNKHRQFVVSALILIVLAVFFWTGSRYPALNEKAMMSGAIQLEDALSFEALFPVDDSMLIGERIFWSTLNWLNTNKKGMVFGVLFAASLLTLAGYLKQKSFKSSFPNAFLGMAIGTPLGVCVNCAAPIARGMYASGLRAETTLSAMIASPTLNIVVLTMLFSLLPFYMAVTKVALSILVILVLVPMIARFLPQTEAPPDQVVQVPWSDTELSLARSSAKPFHQAVLEVAQGFVRNLWYIIKMTVPLMVLAGLLGTMAALFIPADLITTLQFSLAVLILVALVGVFLPVPIGFDVVMAGALLAIGMEQGYVMTLLFTLGAFSVYSFFIVAGSVGPRAAWMLTATVAIMGVFAGWSAQSWHDYQTDRALRMLTSEAQTMMQPNRMYFTGPPPVSNLVTSSHSDRVHISARPFEPRSPAAEAGFTRLEAHEIGIDKPVEFSMVDMWPPFWEGRSLSSGDIDNDGDLDLIIASTSAGLYIYDNDGQGQFSRLDIDLGPLADMDVFNASIVDVDNDGWRDLVIATYREGTFVWPNIKGSFSGSLEPIGNRDDAVLAMALSFADADRDGDLDLALGNWTSGWYRRIPGEESRNRLLWNEGGRFAAENSLDLPGIPGETLSILFSDIDGNGTADLLVGNDFEIPDYVYVGDGSGGFQAITHTDARLPHTTTTTMAIKVADLFNDGAPEIYFAQIAGRSSGVSERLKMQDLDLYCSAIENAAARSICDTNMQIKSWYRSGNNFDPTYASKCQDLTGSLQAECKAMLVKDLAIQRNDPSICKLIPSAQPLPRSYCDLHFLPVRPVTATEAEASIQQILRSNVLLEAEGLRYIDTAETRGLDVGGWSWDTKIADFDLDGWQDIYIVNGTWVPNEVSPSNLFFHNTGQGSFIEASGHFGLEDYLMTASATVFDMDNDGDLDMVTHPVNGPITAFRNNAQTGHAIGFELVDFTGNRDAIGATVALTDEAGRMMSREIQMGGGFMSFDAPRVYFGMGQSASAKEVIIRWPDSTETQIKGPLVADTLYQVVREAH